LISEHSGNIKPIRIKKDKPRICIEGFC
jgi:hypothetical protein